MTKKLQLVIDPGHGGRHPGAINRNTTYPEITTLREADVTLEISRILKTLLDTHPRPETVLTRTTDQTLTLRKRTDLANARDALLVSIHCNSAASPRANGSEVWCFAGTGADGSLSTGYLVAQAIQRELVGLGRRDRGVKAIYDRGARKYINRRLWIVDQNTQRPAVLVECAFISNIEEAILLKTNPHMFAIAIFKGICDSLLGQQETSKHQPIP